MALSKPDDEPVEEEVDRRGGIRWGRRVARRLGDRRRRRVLAGGESATIMAAISASR